MNYYADSRTPEERLNEPKVTLTTASSDDLYQAGRQDLLTELEKEIEDSKNDSLSIQLTDKRLPPPGILVDLSEVHSLLQEGYSSACADILELLHSKASKNQEET